MILYLKVVSVLDKYYEKNKINYQGDLNGTQFVDIIHLGTVVTKFKTLDIFQKSLWKPWEVFVRTICKTNWEKIEKIVGET